MITITFAWWQVLLVFVGVALYQILKYAGKMALQREIAKSNSPISSTRVYMGEQPD